MAIPLVGKIVLDTNVFIDYLRAELRPEWVFGHPAGCTRFLSAVVLMELRLGADTPRRKRAVDRLGAAFPANRVVAPTPEIFDRAGRVFPIIHGPGRQRMDRLAAMNDLLIALTARHIGATVVTRNLDDFARIAQHVSGLRLLSPVWRVAD